LPALNLAACIGISHFVAQAKVAQSLEASLLTHVLFDIPCSIQLAVLQLLCRIADLISLV